MADFAPILAQTFHYEGGYDAKPNDSGNYNSLHQLVGTNHGISAPLYEQYLKRPPTVADMKAITQQTAANIYKKTFWDKLPGDPMKSQSVAHIIFDGFVNSGATMFKVVRSAINDVAGKTVVPYNNKSFSSSEISIINSLPASPLFDAIKTGRENYYEKLVESNPEKYGIYKKGWENRIESFYFDDPVTAIVLAPATIAIAQGKTLVRIWGNKKNRPYIIAGGVVVAAGAGILIHHLTKKNVRTYNS